ncbi:hypothetical protein [Methanosarcina sp. UBA5]|uniref:hypothetical protein n=1 Tax=Methanosarcina sp. UBA5 TaxID=1915593 RepID=UPI0025DAC394|nr:hypothetical protein [Methanosarcina sp. UBA5]
MTKVLGVMSIKGILEVRPLDDIEYQKFVIARTKLFEFSKKQELFRLVDANYMEYKNVLNQYFKIHCENSDIHGTYVEKMVFNINRLVLNFLSAVRTFLDHAETNLKRKYGENSNNFQIFDKACSSCFDHYFSYRFLYKLRNYSQHVGMPIIGLETSSEMVSINPLEADHMLRTITLKNDLLKYDKWGKVKDEIFFLPDRIDINPYIDEMMHCIDTINTTLYGKEEFIELLQYTAFLDKLIKEAKSKDGIPCIFLKIENITDTEKSSLLFSERLRLTVDQFPFNAMELIDLLNLRSQGNSLN